MASISRNGPYKSPTMSGSIIEPLIFGNSHIVVTYDSYDRSVRLYC